MKNKNNSMMIRSKQIFIIVFVLLFFVSALVLGCSTRDAGQTERKQVVKSDVDEAHVQRVLEREIADGRLVEVYDGYITVPSDETKKNWIIIRNVRDRTEQYRIMPCDACRFVLDQISVPPKGYRIIDFDVWPDEGRQIIRVKDRLNNAYGYASFNVIVSD